MLFIYAVPPGPRSTRRLKFTASETRMNKSQAIGHVLRAAKRCTCKLEHCRSNYGPLGLGRARRERRVGEIWALLVVHCI